MEFSNGITAKAKLIRAGQKPSFPAEAASREYAESLDAQDKLAPLRDDFLIPTVSSLKKKALAGTTPQDEDSAEPSIYLIGNSLGAQPKTVRKYLDAQLETWASIGVNGHFTTWENSPLTSWQDMAADCAKKFAPIVGAASPSEVVIMNTLSVNLHLMLASFYRPTEKRHKIIIEWKPFPSDWYAVQSQIEWHGLSPATSMIEIQPGPSPDSASDLYLSTESILATIDAHADSTALLLLPGIQYYTGQLLDMPLITKYAQDRGIIVGWDLAHGVGNVELSLHDWNVDFAVWCTYKYVNAGPGAIGGAFVHERHGQVIPAASTNGVNGTNGANGHHSEMKFTPRLAGWYGNDKSVRFNMERTFQPTPGAQGWVISNPSAVDLASLSAALEIFGKTSMKELRDKALVITGYAEYLLNGLLARQQTNGHATNGNGVNGRHKEEPLFKIISPSNPLERGSQLSILLADRPGLLDKVSKALADNAVVCDMRKPNVIRIAPVPLYVSFVDVWRFVKIFEEALRI